MDFQNYYLLVKEKGIPRNKTFLLTKAGSLGGPTGTMLSHKLQLATMTILGTLTTSPGCLTNHQGKLLQKELMVNQSHDSGVDSMNTNSSGRYLPD